MAAHRAASLVVAALAVPGVVLALVLGRTGEDEPAFVPAPIEWLACGDGAAECGTLQVPLDHDDPSAGTIRLFVARRPAAEEAERLGVVLYVPGAPGVAATPQVTRDRLFGGDVHRRFDVVTWEPRGTSEGTQILCLVGPAWFLLTNPMARSEEERAREAERWRAYAAGCEERSGRLLPHVSTVASARDLDLLRAALGEERLSLFGASYGAALGTVYATLFPDRVRAAVLDGGYDLSAPLERLQTQQAVAMERALTSLLRRCAEDEDCVFASDGDPFAAFDALLARLEEEPDRVGWRSVGVIEALGAVSSALASGQSERLLRALEEARRGRPHTLRALAEERLEPRHTARAIHCLDRPRAHWDVSAETVADVRADAPRLGSFLVPGFHPCSIWPVAPDPAPRLAAGAAGPLLVLGSSGDLATPLAWSRDLAARLENGALLVVEHDRHPSYLDADLECVRRTVERFLVHREAPADGSVCAPGGPRPRDPAPAVG